METPTLTHQFRSLARLILLHCLSKKYKYSVLIDLKLLGKHPSHIRELHQQTDIHNTAPYKETHLPPYSELEMPTHQAYVPDAICESPVISIDSSGTIRMSTYSSPHQSPRNNLVPPPPLINVPGDGTGSKPVQTHSSQVEAPIIRGGTPSPPYVRVDTQIPSRTLNRTDSSRRNTSRVGIGNALASNISPIGVHGSAAGPRERFDFELAERERREKYFQEQRARRKKADMTPESAERQEQWPGSYQQ